MSDESVQLGTRLRGMRAAAGRTVASVAADAGLSVPYIANLENGRGNPTLAALERLATALGASLQVSFTPAGGQAEVAAAGLTSGRPTGARPAGARPTSGRPTGARPTGAGPTGARPAGARPTASSMPASLVRLGRSSRFRRDAELIASAVSADPGELSVDLIAALAGLASALGIDPGEAGWHRLFDALLLIALH
jgi:transcriptional regulator with XRE-family HTH domain